jgi:putative addiction module component (TIGR02574 family)
VQSALALPDHDRADLAAELIASLDPGADADYEAAWSAEIQKRLSLHDSGAVQTIPWHEARERIIGP